jgi:hydroxymethylbilane synthase
VSRPILICTRGSALALAQSNQVLHDLRQSWPEHTFELKVIKTTGDKLQTASMAQPGESLPKGLFTKELEVALLAREADLAVHSLKDLPTELPEGLQLTATPPRADVRDVLLYRDAAHADFAARRAAPRDWSPSGREPFYDRQDADLRSLPPKAIVATSSTRRAAQVKLARPDVEVIEIRGNVDTRLRKLVENEAFDATLLAAAGLVRLQHFIGPRGELRLDPRLSAEALANFKVPPPGVLAAVLEPEEMLPAVGQGAVGLETRTGDDEINTLVAALNHRNTFLAVTAERAFLRGMGGGCQSPVAAYARVLGHQLELRAASYREATPRSVTLRRPVAEAIRLGELAAAQLQ